MSFVKYEPKGNIAYLIIDREKALNALNSQVLADLDAALDAVDLSEIRCLIVRGAGEKSFVAGADIAQMKELSKEEAEAFGKQGTEHDADAVPRRGEREVRAREADDQNDDAADGEANQDREDGRRDGLEAFALQEVFFFHTAASSFAMRLAPAM